MSRRRPRLVACRSWRLRRPARREGLWFWAVEGEPVTTGWVAFG